VGAKSNEPQKSAKQKDSDSIMEAKITTTLKSVRNEKLFSSFTFSSKFVIISLHTYFPLTLYLEAVAETS
jgi:hypothetical protein